jgi:hypothetical protein
MTAAVIITRLGCPFCGDGRSRSHESDSGTMIMDDHGAAVIAIYYSGGVQVNLVAQAESYKKSRQRWRVFYEMNA